MNERERGGARRWDDPDDPDVPEGVVARDTGSSVDTERMPGPMGPNAATESVGDPDANDPRAGAVRGAAAGGAIGGGIAGPFGVVPGVVAGAAAGAAHELTDPIERRDPSRLTGTPGSEGTGPDDPRYAPELQPRTRGEADEAR